MTVDETPPSTNAELKAEFKELLRSAHENGVDVRGGFECRNGVEHPDWDVVVTELAKNEPSE